LVLALLWFPLRWYSEWYINFGNIGDDSRHFSNKCPEVLLAAAFLFLLIMLTFGFSKRKSEVVLHSNPLVFALAVCQFFLIVILRWLYGIFDNLAVAVNNEDSSVLYLVYLMFIIFIISLGAYIIRDTKEGIRNYAKKVILFVTSSPKRYDLEALDFGEEFRAIVSGVATGKAKDYFEVKIAPSITKGEFKDYLEREQPTILHIAMHASLGDGLFFQNEKGDAEPMTTDEFVDILKHVSINEKIETIIFSACNSLPFAEKSKSFCSNAVGMKMPIPDRATAVYALYFYKNLINNITENISLCHNEGKWGLKNHNPPFKPVITPFATAPVDEIPSLI
jgi:hypothetical protein